MTNAQYLTRDEALKIARACAYAKHHEHGYLPTTKDTAASWQPHEWVLDSIRWRAPSEPSLSQELPAPYTKGRKETPGARDVDCGAGPDLYTADQMREYGASFAALSRPQDGVYGLLRSIRYNAEHGSQDRPPHERLRLIARDVNEALTRCESQLSATPTAGQGGDDLPFATTQMVVRALTQLGHSTPQSQEEQYARSNELVLTLCREVLASKQEPTPAPAAPVSERARIVAMLVDVAQAAHRAMDDCGDLLLTEQGAKSLSDALDALDELPDFDDGYVRTGWAKAKDHLVALDARANPAAGFGET